MERKRERTLNHFNKMFCVGESHSPDRCLAEASASSNVLPPPLYGMRKDYKVIQPGQERVGPAIRSVCATVSSFLTRVLNDYPDAVGKCWECKRSEDMRASLKEYNINTSNKVRAKSMLLSMDIKALYLSMRVKFIVRADRELILESDLEAVSVD